ncbi:hypothetical protein [Spiroplasma sp. SV19]|uniref:hypothetical protein n=1 Tax=Spiroplasma sp. SV19 TaxID=2570468 RepID=UPI0024B7A220|nr:hypothetical protein [Spiroplasma sp. SV19]WHQ37488.1 hypothetical protein E7Y35_06550 [Spiroplasma sp. SV19]
MKTPSENFHINLNSLTKICKSLEKNEVYFIVLISMIFTFFEKFIKELIQFKNSKILEKLQASPKYIFDFNELEKSFYFSSNKGEISNLVQNVGKHNEEFNLNKIKDCIDNLNDIFLQKI